MTTESSKGNVNNKEVWGQDVTLLEFLNMVLKS